MIEYDTIFIYVPSTNEIIEIAEGLADNLTDEDIRNGYVDYIYYSQHAAEKGFPCIDGGQVVLKDLFRDKYSKTEDCIPEVLETVYASAEMEYILLQKERSNA